MILYNQLFKENPAADKLLAVIGMSREDFGRYRDIYLSRDGSQIIVYTRIGGNNRPYFKEQIEGLKQRPNMLRISEDASDHTYAYVTFKVPSEYMDICRHMAIKQGRPETVHEKFDRVHKDMSRMKTRQEMIDSPTHGPYLKAIEEAISRGDSAIRIYDDDMPQDLRV